jgi:nucleoside-diphosphate-sugar epimerase
MRALVTGASGYLGARLVRRLMDERAEIVAVARDSRGSDWPPGVQPASCDLGQTASVGELVRRTGPVDVIYHMAAVTSGSHAEAMRGTVVGTRNLLEAFAGMGARVVLASSFSVYKLSALSRWDVLDEDTPIEDTLRLRDSYTITKTRQELLARELCPKLGFPLVVVRPGKIYGPGTIGLPPQLGLDIKGVAFVWMGGSHLLPLTHVSNCADAIYLAGVRDTAVGATLNVVDDDLPTQRAFMRLHRRCRGPVPRAVHVPDWIFALFVRMMEWGNRATKGNVPPVLTRYRAANLWRPLRYSNARARQVLGWQPKIGWVEGVTEMLSAPAGQQGRPGVSKA